MSNTVHDGIYWSKLKSESMHFCNQWWKLYLFLCSLRYCLYNNIMQGSYFVRCNGPFANAVIIRVYHRRNKLLKKQHMEIIMLSDSQIELSCEEPFYSAVVYTESTICICSLLICIYIVIKNSYWMILHSIEEIISSWFSCISPWCHHRDIFQFHDDQVVLH